MSDELPAPSPGKLSAKKVKENIWEIPTTYKGGMRVPARIYASDKLMKEMDDQVFDQLTNVACLPGIVKFAHCMPDAHSGYGFPIGGVAAFDPDKEGVISPGGIGFDINCLSPDSIIHLKDGCWLSIADLEKHHKYAGIALFDHASRSKKESQIDLFLKRNEEDKIYDNNENRKRVEGNW